MFDTFVKERGIVTTLVGISALEANGLVAGYNCYFVWTPYEFMNGVPIDDVVLEYYHFNDDYGLVEFSDRLFIPSGERAIIDTIAWIEKNGCEEFVIEAIQKYCYVYGHKVSDLYECANHYSISNETVDYWWNEAMNEMDMSMG